jgi:hypothetical protein
MGRRKGKSTSAASRTDDIDADNDILSEHYTITGSIAGDNDSSFAAWDDDDEAEGACIPSVACLHPVGYSDTSTTTLLLRRCLPPLKKKNDGTLI